MVTVAQVLLACTVEVGDNTPEPSSACFVGISDVPDLLSGSERTPTLSRSSRELARLLVGVIRGRLGGDVEASLSEDDDIFLC